MIFDLKRLSQLGFKSYTKDVYVYKINDTTHVKLISPNTDEEEVRLCQFKDPIKLQEQLPELNESNEIIIYKKSKHKTYSYLNFLNLITSIPNE